MDDAAPMGRPERLAQRHAEPRYLGCTNAAPHRQNTFQAPPLEQLEHQVRRAIFGLAGVERRHHARVTRRRQGQRLTQEARARLGRHALLGNQQLQRNRAPGIQVLSFEDSARAAAGDLTLE
jgi:hypothetical protein